MSQALKEAIEANDPKCVAAALKSVKDVNRKLPGASAPVFFAAKMGADRVIDVLVDAGAKLHWSAYQENPLKIASEKDNESTVERIIARMAKSKCLKQGDAEDIVQTLCMDKRVAGVRAVMKHLKPKISAQTIFHVVSQYTSDTRAQSRELLAILVAHGADINAKGWDDQHPGESALNIFAERMDELETVLLLEAGADANCRGANGRTPLMAHLQNLRSIPTEELKPQDLTAFMEILFEHGADASLTDRFGNDAIMYYEFGVRGRRRCGRLEPAVVAMLEKAGARGGGATSDLFRAVEARKLSGIKSAARAGADLNRPWPGSGETPLMIAGDDLQCVKALLEAGADPNAPGADSTPLIKAALQGDLKVVKALIAAGADPGARAPENAHWETAVAAAKGNRRFKVVDYLKPLKTSPPKQAKWNPIRAGAMFNWNDFDEVLVKGDPAKVAAALAKIARGKAQPDVYDKSIKPGKTAYLVARPRGLAWCNVFRIAPSSWRGQDTKKTETFCKKLLDESGMPVLWAGYSDTAGAAFMRRYETNGNVEADDEWDQETLSEMIEAMGKKAPKWALDKLKKLEAAASGEGDVEDDGDSLSRLEVLAKKEKLALGVLHVAIHPGRPVDVSFEGYPREAFDAVVLVTS